MGDRKSAKESSLVKISLVIPSERVEIITKKNGSYFKYKGKVNILANRGNPVGDFKIYFQNSKLLPNYLKLPNGDNLTFRNSNPEDPNELIAEGTFNSKIADNLNVFFNRYQYQMNVLCCEQSADLEKEGLLLAYHFESQKFRFPRGEDGSPFYPLHYTKSS